MVFNTTTITVTNGARIAPAMITSPGDTNDLLNIYKRQLLRRTPQVELYSHDLLFGAITHRYIQAFIRIFPNCAHSYYNASDCCVTSVTFGSIPVTCGIGIFQGTVSRLLE